MTNLTLDKWLKTSYPDTYKHWLAEKKTHTLLKRREWYKNNRGTGRPTGRPKKKDL